MLRKTFIAFSLPLLLSVTPVSAQDLTQEQVKDLVKEVIRDNPQLIMESLVQYEQDQKAAQRQAGLDKVQAILQDRSYPRLGNPDAMPVGVVFLDYNCPHCRNTHAEIDAWLKNNPERSLVILDFPVLGPGSVLSARAALAAQEQGKYSEALHALMSTQGQNTDQNIEQTLSEAGFDVSALAQTMSEEGITRRLQDNNALAMQLGITGTPGAVFGDQVISGGFRQADLDAWTQ